MKKNTLFTYRATEIIISKSGKMQNGQNAGKYFVRGQFKTTVKVQGEERVILKGFQAFDSQKSATAERIIQLASVGNEIYLTGEFINGQLKEPNDPSKGHWQNLKVVFVQTPEERSTFFDSMRQQENSEAEETV